MSHELSPASEAYLNELVEQQVFPDRATALQEAIDLLKRRQDLQAALKTGLDALAAGESTSYDESDRERFVNDIRRRVNASPRTS